MSRILAEDFASVIDDPHLSEVAEAFKLAKGEEAAVQKDVIGQVSRFQPAFHHLLLTTTSSVLAHRARLFPRARPPYAALSFSTRRCSIGTSSSQ